MYTSDFIGKEKSTEFLTDIQNRSKLIFTLWVLLLREGHQQARLPGKVVYFFSIWVISPWQ